MGLLYFLEWKNSGDYWSEMAIVHKTGNLCQDRAKGRLYFIATCINAIFRRKFRGGVIGNGA